MVLRAVSNSLVIFLSTLSLRRATIISQTIFIWVNNFYPRSPYGERLYRCCAPSGSLHYFYPRSPYGERRRLWVEQQC